MKLFYNGNYDQIFLMTQNKQIRDILNEVKEKNIHQQDDKTSRHLQNVRYPYFSDYMMHWTIRHAQVLEEENREKTLLHRYPPPPPVSQVSYVWTIRCTLIFLPNLRGKVFYSPKNVVYLWESVSEISILFHWSIVYIFTNTTLS